MLNDGQLLRTLASCHSLTRINNEINGDPLDVKMFESTKWHFIDDSSDTSQSEHASPIVKQDKV
jgi:cation-transporting P-type ATPase 13A2